MENMKILIFAVCCIATFASAEGCSDMVSPGMCALWKMDNSGDYCTTAHAYERCRKFCKLCDSGPITDPIKTTNPPAVEECRNWVAKSMCEKWKRDVPGYCNREKVEDYCKKTCGLCGDSTSNHGSCGISQVQQSRIVNGVDAQEGAWPWIASLQKNGGHWCGGSLITPTWVLTASHCVTENNPDIYQVIMGAHDQTDRGERSQQIFNVKQIIMHPDYPNYSGDADLALVELDRPAVLNDRVTLACLPQKNVYPQLGTQCYIAGWGALFHPSIPYHTLQQARLPVVEGSKCVHNSQVVCVGKGYSPRPDGSQQPNACGGDSGGPLVCQQPDGRWHLEGVASFVVEYCKYYTGYAPVNKYLDWINQYI